MICRCFGRSLDISALARGVGQTAQLMVGVPDYAAYLAHQTADHPDREPMTREMFFRERQTARYGTGGGMRCC